MMEMKAQWRAWAQRVAALSLRERVLILLTGVVVVGAVAIYGWLDGAAVRLEQERLALSTAQRDLEIMDLENQGKQAKLTRDPDLHVRTQLAQLDGELGKLDAEALFVGPAQLFARREELGAVMDEGAVQGCPKQAATPQDPGNRHRRRAGRVGRELTT